MIAAPTLLERVRRLLVQVELTVQAQTPPRGGLLPFYKCPVCGADRSTRAEFRAHLTVCDRYRDEVFRRAFGAA